MERKYWISLDNLSVRKCGNHVMVRSHQANAKATLLTEGASVFYVTQAMSKFKE